jgi:hypothetical protein
LAEIYLKWLPIDDIPFPLDLDEIRKNENGLSILLNSEDHTDKFLHIHFSVYESFREIGEEFKTKFWHEVDIEEDYPLFIVENSEWLEWFHLQSENSFRDMSIQHYAIWTTENWIDILSGVKPIVQWKKK